MRTLDTWYANMNVDEVTRWIRAEVRDKKLAKRDEQRATQDIAKKARTRDSVRVFAEGQVRSTVTCAS